MSIKLNAASGGSVSLDAPTQTTNSADITLKLPVADGSAGQALKTDGSGNLSFGSAGLSYGVTDLDAWAISSGYTASAGSNIMNTNWYRFATASDTHFPQLGGAMTQNNGVFTFPSTGFWVMEFTLGGYNISDNSGTYFGGQIFFSNDNGSSYDRISTAYTNMMGSSDHGEVFMKAYVDVTNTSACSAKFHTNLAASKTIFGDADEMRSGVVFTRIGDT